MWVLLIFILVTAKIFTRATATALIFISAVVVALVKKRRKNDKITPSSVNL